MVKEMSSDEMLLAASRMLAEVGFTKIQEADPGSPDYEEERVRTGLRMAAAIGVSGGSPVYAALVAGGGLASATPEVRQRAMSFIEEATANPEDAKRRWDAGVDGVVGVKGRLALQEGPSGLETTVDAEASEREQPAPDRPTMGVDREREYSFEEGLGVVNQAGVYGELGVGAAKLLKSSGLWQGGKNVVAGASLDDFMGGYVTGDKRVAVFMVGHLAERTSSAVGGVKQKLQKWNRVDNANGLLHPTPESGGKQLHYYNVGDEDALVELLGQPAPKRASKKAAKAPKGGYRARSSAVEGEPGPRRRRQGDEAPAGEYFFLGKTIALYLDGSVKGEQKGYTLVSRIGAALLRDLPDVAADLKTVGRTRLLPAGYFDAVHTYMVEHAGDLGEYVVVPGEKPSPVFYKGGSARRAEATASPKRRARRPAAEAGSGGGGLLDKVVTEEGATPGSRRPAPAASAGAEERPRPSALWSTEQVYAHLNAMGLEPQHRDDVRTGLRSLGIGVVTPESGAPGYDQKVIREQAEAIIGRIHGLPTLPGT